MEFALDSTGESPAADPTSQHPDQSGLITAAEWNDLDHWAFWQELTLHQEFGPWIGEWQIPTFERLSVRVADAAGEPARDVLVEVRDHGGSVYAKTNGKGRAELFLKEPGVEPRVYVDGHQVEGELPTEGDGAIGVRLNYSPEDFRAVDLAFVVDATGSMGDELEFLKDDLRAIISEVDGLHGNVAIRTAAVFYRDQGDTYVTRHHAFTRDLSQTVNFIGKQSAEGGGDFPEAVHSGLRVALRELAWSKAARTRIVFLLLDAPPHGEEEIMEAYRELLGEATRTGIHIVPVVASGIDKPTEFLMRLTAIVTNGTYVFITDDSGIGNDHLEATVGEFEVEYLKDLLVRVIGEYID